eukprot:CAMPEP_0197630234 /NCGR_PEP_ID=MMETSP1338-20131121/7789_1 /TAXON_ID=43686 ORGANISM="Pelagodinium beii, Strain RCC1491" /NCGR_SAMPLE_ID=MMETSP1338 /ASSEMBLY_ACC=CAM_ASM_000754 /LENGTH=419 /DNA_ID=CAMNT_0043201419 /DNA_START=29 /DNA_END=1288 /DNA_ORIENTATION=+
MSKTKELMQKQCARYNSPGPMHMQRHKEVKHVQQQRPCLASGTTGHRVGVGRDSGEGHEVTTFLRQIGMEQHGALLIHNGFDDMETLAMLEEDHMRDMGMPLGHILKLRKRLDARSHMPCRQPGLSYDSLASVTRSWLLVQAWGLERVAEIFYKNLFKVAPVTKKLFPLPVRLRHRDWTSPEVEDPNEPDDSPALRKLFCRILEAIGSAVAGLQDIKTLVPHLTALGMRHMHYNMKAEYFHHAGGALMMTLESMQGVFTPDVKLAWGVAYDLISASIVSGLNMAQAREAEIKALTEKLSVERDSRAHGFQKKSSRDRCVSTEPMQPSKDQCASTESSPKLAAFRSLAAQAPPYQKQLSLGAGGLVTILCSPCEKVVEKILSIKQEPQGVGSALPTLLTSPASHDRYPHVSRDFTKNLSI